MQTIIAFVIILPLALWAVDFYISMERKRKAGYEFNIKEGYDATLESEEEATYCDDGIMVEILNA